MATYGTASWLFNEQLGLKLPRTIDRNNKESLISFYKRVQGIENKINEKIRRHTGSSVTGLWQKENKSKPHQVQHNQHILP